MLVLPLDLSGKEILKIKKNLSYFSKNYSSPINFTLPVFITNEKITLNVWEILETYLIQLNFTKESDIVAECQKLKKTWCPNIWDKGKAPFFEFTASDTKSYKDVERYYSHYGTKYGNQHFNPPTTTGLTVPTNLLASIEELKPHVIDINIFNGLKLSILTFFKRIQKSQELLFKLNVLFEALDNTNKIKYKYTKKGEKITLLHILNLFKFSPQSLTEFQPWVDWANQKVNYVQMPGPQKSLEDLMINPLLKGLDDVYIIALYQKDKNEFALPLEIIEKEKKTYKPGSLQRTLEVSSSSSDLSTLFFKKSVAHFTAQKMFAGSQIKIPVIAYYKKGVLQSMEQVFEKLELGDLSLLEVNSLIDKIKLENTIAPLGSIDNSLNSLTPALSPLNSINKLPKNKI